MIQIPVTLVTLAGEKPYTLTWQTSVPADEYVSSALGSSPEVGGVRFNVAKPMLVDGRATAKNVQLVEYNREGVQTKVCTWGCTERGFLGYLMSTFAVVVADLSQVRETPWMPQVKLQNLQDMPVPRLNI